MKKSLHSTLRYALQLMLMPIVRFCMKNSLGLQDLIESAKIAFIKAAVEELESEGEKINFSRLTAATGVHRKDAVRIYRDRDVQEESTRFISRVIGQWTGDSRFTTRAGKPRVLTFDGEGSGFYTLVNSIGVDLKPGTVLFDLERVGAVEKTKKGLKLKARMYVPKNVPLEALKILGHDTEDFMMAVLENIYEGGEDPPNIHVTTVYDNISESDLKRIRNWFSKQCGLLHRKAEAYISKYDLDINPNPKKRGGKRVVLGSFTRT